ncbi:hypothetical protein MSMEI_5503 [Mycolicibacterium smegmatis MC2 155]|uniref:Uncharacterized protein n=1 Tax=Mycolicibacterium smegmatis (strain ATCC 700084 / mc(2)155) TaxID=246196 RepID=I7FSW4_MYCS2|nr:hypothetical protein MSMEI_5503 [Mycolicibacterium smegmatis MC2 155]
MCHVQALCRPPEVQFLGEDDEAAQVSHVEAPHTLIDNSIR